MKTKTTKKRQIKRDWHKVNLDGEIIGRQAGAIAHLLRGKGKPYYVPHLDCGDYVVVINASKVRVSGNKEQQKLYTRYSGYPGGLKTETFEELKKRKPAEIVRRAVSGMLPKNKLRKKWLTRLYIYPEDKHPYSSKFQISNDKA